MDERKYILYDIKQIIATYENIVVHVNNQTSSDLL